MAETFQNITNMNNTDDCTYRNDSVNGTVYQLCDNFTQPEHADQNGATLTRKNEVIVTCVMLSIIWVIGVVGNGLVIQTYKKRYDNFASHLFLLAIGINDFLTCLLLIPQTLYLFVISRNSTHFRVVASLLVLVVLSSILLLSGMAVDRWAAIKHPFLFTIAQKRVKGIITGGFGLALLITFIYCMNSFIGVRLATTVIGLSLVIILIMYAAIIMFVCRRNTVSPTAEAGPGVQAGSSSQQQLEPSTSGLQVPPSNSFLSPNSSQVKNSNNFARPGPSSGSSSSSSPAYSEVVQQMQQQLQKQKLRNHLIKTSRLLFLIILSYLISFLPSLLYLFNFSDIPVYYVNTYYISHAANPIIYSFTNKEFRKQLAHLRKARCCERYM